MQKKQKHVHTRSIKERPKQRATWRVIIVHGLRSHPADCWFPWLKQALEKREFAVRVPRMPNPAAPEMKKWVAVIARAVGEPDERTILVGHSLGVIALLRYLETLQNGERVAGLVSVAGRVMGKPYKRYGVSSFFQSPIRWNALKRRAKKFIGIYSIDDPLVSTENGKIFARKLGAQLLFVQNKGHFSREDKVFKLPAALGAVLFLRKRNGK
jgi:uncharacterized protein